MQHGCRTAAFDDTTVMMLLSSQLKNEAKHGEEFMVVITTSSYSYGIACIRCNERMIAPNWSEYVNEHHVRHSWSCESCGHQFERLDDVRGSASTKTRRKIPTLQLLVA
jgi:primosomal protein N'